MTETAPAGGADARARLDAAQAAAARASADVARADKPLLEAAQAALSADTVSALEAELDELHGLLSDVAARQALANVWMILAATRRMVAVRLSAADQTIALAPQEPAS